MNYSEKLRFVQNKIMEYTSTILQVYGNQLELKLEEYNLLQNKNNCIQSSTAIGYILEEFLVSKLEIYTATYSEPNNVQVHRTQISTQASSYDCYVTYQGVKILINLKAEKQKSNNNGISAVNKLYNDYCATDIEIEKAFLVFKVVYDFNEVDNKRKICISNAYSFYLEELSFANGFKKDNRNWSKEFKDSSGRIMISKSFVKKNKISDDEMSYNRTKNIITEWEKPNIT